jgi:DNA polymerase-3 subunit beta
MILKTTDLNNALKALSGVIPQKSPVPIVENVFIKKHTDNSVYVLGTNYETFMCLSMLAEEPEDILMPFGLFFKTVQSISSEYIEINGGQIKAGNSVFNIQPMNHEDFPQLPSLVDGKTIELSRTHFQSALQTVVPFVATDDLRPVMSGINILVEDEMMKVYGSDATVLMRVEIPVNYHEKLEATINKNFARMVQFFNEEIELIVTDKQICLRDEETTMFSRRIEGVMPKFDTVFPNIKNSCVVKGLADTMLKSFNLAAIYANKNSNLLKVTVSDCMLIESQDLDFSVSSSVKHNCEIDGSAMVGLSSQKVVPVLQVMKTLPVEFYIGDPNRAVYFKSSLCDGLIMPMLIS